MVTCIHQWFLPLAFTEQDFPLLPESILSQNFAQSGEPQPILACKD